MESFDEEAPKPTPAPVIGEELATLSISELEERVELLRAEINRIEEAISAKRTSLDVADSFFKR